MTNIRAGLVLMALLCLSAHASAADVTQVTRENTLVMGVLPFVSTVTLFKRFSPLVDHINAELKTKVVLETAPSFDEFLNRTNNRMYDLILTAPHFVVHALDSGKYKLIAMPTNYLTAQVVVSKTSDISSLDQLAGKVVATPSPKALITKAGTKFLEKAGLVDSWQPVYMAFRTHNAAYHEVLSGKADAAIMSINVLSKALKEGKPLKSIAVSPGLPGVGIMVAKDLPNDLSTSVQKLLVDLKKHTKGQAVLKQVAYPGFKLAQPSDYHSMRDFISK